MADTTGQRSTSPSESRTSQDTRKVKFKRLRGSCDECRRKKIGCMHAPKSFLMIGDSAKVPGNICTHCKRFNLACTHYMFRMPKKSQTQTEYILKLESRIEMLEKYIRRMHPGEDLDKLINPSPGQDAPSPALHISNMKETESTIAPDAVSSTAPPEDIKSDLSEDDDLAHVALSEHLSHLSLDMIEDRYFGQAGTFMLANQVSALRREITCSTEPDDSHRRLLYWDLKPWELAYFTTIETVYEYPEDDLLITLVSLFFEKTHCLLPILHQPTFLASLSVGQHYWDTSFGMTVLMVCALGSRYSDDPRVFLRNDVSELSAGWKYYSQIPLHRNSMLCRSDIYDLQYYALACLFLVGTSMAHAAFNMTAIGLRYACEKGIHRRRGPHSRPTVESEMQKRAFWALFCLDRLGYANTGRPCSFSEEYSDVEYPIECDDEYWEPNDPQKAFQQPIGKPCSITAYIHYIKLCEILGIALRTLYVNKKSRLIAGFVGSEWERTMVAELDSSMNKWKNCLPEYLTWDPNGRDTIFFKQAANLHTMFCCVRIQIHRPFLFKKSSLSFASLAMCTNAARSCTQTLETAMLRGALSILPNILLAAFAAGNVIALGLWGSFRTGLTGDPSSDLEMFHRCINVLRVCEKRWNGAGRVCDVLNEAISIRQYHAMAAKTLLAESSLPKATTIETPSDSDVPRADCGPNFSFDEPLYHLDQDYQEFDRLLLTEMGYFPRNDPMNVLGASSGGTLPIQYKPSNEVVDLSGSGSENQTFTLWSDFSAAFNSSEEWEAYLTTMKNSHNF